MADQKISELTALTGANVADDDAIAIVDTSATETKKIVFSELKNALDSATGFVRITGDTMTGNLSMGDNVKAIFGASSDLQIYHNANNSYVQDVGTGKLHITSNGTGVSIDKGTSELMATFDIDGAVTLYHDNSQKLATESGGVNITGVLTSDGLEVDAGSGTNAGVTIRMGTGNSGANDSFIGFENSAGTEIIRTRYDNPLTSYVISSDTSGDILSVTRSGNVGIGTSSPNSYSNQTVLTINGTDYGRVDLEAGGTLKGSVFGGGDGLNLDAGANQLVMFAGGSEAMRLDSSGTLLVGKTASDSGTVGFEAAQDGHVYVTVNNTLPLYINRQSGDELLRFASNGATVGSIASVGGSDIKVVLSSDGDQYITGNATSNYMTFSAANQERMRLDSSGRLLHGKTTSGDYVTGTEIQPAGAILSYRSGGVAAIHGRTDNGEIIRLTSNSSIVGIIGVSGPNSFIGTGDTGLHFAADLDVLNPWNTSTNSVRDAAISLGWASGRYKDLHLSGSIEIENGTGNVGVGKQALNSNTGSRNTAIGLEAGEQNITGNYNVFVGSYAGEQSTASQQTFVGENAGYLVTTGEKNTILGRYNGNQGGLDIRTGSNNIVLSDGDGNPRLYLTSGGALNVAELDSLTTASAANVFIATDGFLKKSTSSLRYKNTVNDATHGLTELMSLRSVTYKGNNDGDTVFGGLIAEEVHDAGLTEFVQYNDNDEPDALAYGNMVSLCIKAIQEQQATITALTARITALENA